MIPHEGVDHAIEKVADYHKKTRVPLHGMATTSSKTVQLVVKLVGESKDRFGSVSFSIKRLLNNGGHTFLHWVTLYSELDDDLFEGYLGEDDELDFPRVLLEYSVVSSKFTSVMSKVEQLKVKAEGAMDK